MNTTRHWAAAAFVVATSGVLVPRAAVSEQPRGDVIIEWNQLLQRNIAGPPIGQPRSYAMLHIAMADAVVAIDGQYRPFHAKLRAPSGASAEAAAAQAGHDGSYPSPVTGGQDRSTLSPGKTNALAKAVAGTASIPSFNCPG